MHVIAPLKGKVALVQKPSVWEEEIQDKKSLWTKKIPLDKNSPGTRNPRDK